MTMTQKTLSTSLIAALFAFAFSSTLLMGALGPAINVAPAAASQTYVI